MNKNRKTYIPEIILVLFLFYLAGRLVIGTAKFINQRDINQQAEAWLNHAARSVNSKMTKEDAVHLLQYYRAEMITEGLKIRIDGQEKNFNAIMGSQRMSQSSVWTDPVTAVLIIDFDDEWHFKNVRMEMRTY